MSIEDAKSQMEAAVQQAIAGAIQSSAAGSDDYATLRATFRLAAAPDPGGFIRNDAGQLLYSNGTIVDPRTGDIYFPTSKHGVDPENIPGSAEWMANIQDKWSDDKANDWRKRLSAQGYEVAESGGMAHDLLNALATYHETRYLNFGKVQSVAPGGAAAGTRLKDVVDPVALREEVKAWGQVPFEEDLDEDTAAYFSDRVLDVARRLIKEKGWDATRAFEGAGVRVQKEFLKDENVAGAIEEAEDDEMDESLRESIVSIAQLGAI